MSSTMYKLKLHSCGKIIFFNKNKLDFFNRLNFTIDFFIAVLLFQQIKKIYAKIQTTTLPN